MWASLLTLVPTGLVLGLIAFGSYGTRPRPEPTWAKVAVVSAVALVIGPVSVAAIGFFFWLVLVAILASSLTIAAMLRTPPARQPLHR